MIIVLERSDNRFLLLFWLLIIWMHIHIAHFHIRIHGLVYIKFTVHVSQPISLVSILCMVIFIMHGYPWFPGFRWLPLVIVGYPWFPVVIIGYPWFSVVMLGFCWLSLVFSGYPWLSLVSSGYHWLLSWLSLVFSGYPFGFQLVILGSWFTSGYLCGYHCFLGFQTLSYPWFSVVMFSVLSLVFSNW